MGTKYNLRIRMVNLELCVLFGASVTSGAKVLFGEKTCFTLRTFDKLNNRLKFAITSSRRAYS